MNWLVGWVPLAFLIPGLILIVYCVLTLPKGQDLIDVSTVQGKFCLGIGLAFLGAVARNSILSDELEDKEE